MRPAGGLLFYAGLHINDHRAGVATLGAGMLFVGLMLIKSGLLPPRPPKHFEDEMP